MHQGILINKYNLLEHYAEAWSQALKVTTITTAFMKMGIHPYNPDIIHPSLYEPSLNTTTQAAQPIPASIPLGLITTLESSSKRSEYTIKSTVTTLAFTLSMESTPLPSFSGSLIQSEATANLDLDDSDVSDDDQQPMQFTLPIAMLIAHGTTLKDVQQQNETLITILKALCWQVQADYTQMHLMDLENEKLHQKLFSKSKKKKDKKITSDAQHMTSNEILNTLAKAKWDALMKLVFVEACPTFQKLLHDITHHYKQLATAEKARLKREEQAKKDQKKAEEQEERVEERKRKAEERAKAKAVWEQMLYKLKAVRAVEREKKAAEKMVRATQKATEKIAKVQKVGKLNLDSDSELESPESEPGDETDQTSSKAASEDEGSANLIIADFAALNIGRGCTHRCGRGRTWGHAVGQGQGHGSEQNHMSEDDVNVIMQEALVPSTTTVDQQICPRTWPQPIVKQGKVDVPPQGTSSGVGADEQEENESQIGGTGSGRPIVDEIDEEPKVATPERHYPQRTRC